MNSDKEFVDRRKILFSLGSAGIVLSAPLQALASIDSVNSVLEKITNGMNSAEVDIFLDLPEIAENGNQVKLAFEIESPMLVNDYVRTVHILADGNPAPKVAKFMFTPAMGVCAATTRIRLAKTQDIYLLAEFSNGSYSLARATVKVTIGGCGG